MSDGRDGHIWSVVESDIPKAGHVVIEIVNVITIFTIRIRQNTETLMTNGTRNMITERKQLHLIDN